MSPLTPFLIRYLIGCLATFASKIIWLRWFWYEYVLSIFRIAFELTKKKTIRCSNDIGFLTTFSSLTIAYGLLNSIFNHDLTVIINLLRIYRLHLLCIGYIFNGPRIT